MDSQTPGDIQELEKWIESTIRYDENARKQYATDRKRVRGDSALEVTANLFGTLVDVTASFLVAKAPDVDVQPARAIEPPSIDALRDMAADLIKQKPEIQQAGQMTQIAAEAMDVPGADKIAGQIIDIKTEEEINELATKLRKRYSRRQRDAKVMGESIELMVSDMWEQAKIKRRVNGVTRSALSLGIGWLKASMQVTTERDNPVTVSKLNTLKDNLARLKAAQADVMDSSAQDPETEAKIAEIQLQIDAINERAEQVVSKDFVCDLVNGEDMIVAPGVMMADYLDAPRIVHRIPMSLDDAKAAFPELARKTDGKCCLDDAKKFYPRQPTMQERAPPIDASSAEEADKFTGHAFGEGQQPWVMLMECWDKTTNHVKTWIQGTKQWAREPYIPKASTRFYPFFQTIIGHVEGERHPQSLVSRSADLIDEYNRIGSAEVIHRRRIRPKILFDKTKISPDSMKAVNNAETAEAVGIERTDPNTLLSELLYVPAYPAMDGALYNRAPIMAEIERVWGVQEALSASVSVPKTATEADIQQQGFNSRTDDKREAIEDMLTDLASYSAELALTNFTQEEVWERIGPDAIWPQIEKPEQLRSLARVTIKAGSTGRPNSEIERQSWSILLPQLVESVEKIGALRQASPEEMADRLEDLLRITAARSGDDRLDVDSLVPQGGGPQPILPGQTVMPGMEAPGQLSQVPPTDPGIPPA